MMVSDFDNFYVKLETTGDMSPPSETQQFYHPFFVFFVVSGIW